ncbi:MAG: serine/threonine-protein kinase [Ignavibacteria bacterium]|nr:serine/threonine protein kinase [Ignavibacteria bacterium]MBK8383820.1 serine/threonine protein kinase [Ignavibacteria bacterium]MBK9403695.1 serine/threonine protein kinase [Ignavibacteria bacterium]
MIGVTLNSYKIVKKISEGGMGEIYLAEHKFLERKAAVKILHKTYSGNKDIRQRFIQEAQTLSRLDHPYIVKIFDFDQYQDVFYIIMEFVSGYTLEEYTRVKNGLMPEHIAKDFFVKVLSAVNYAHNNSIVHRDIKPSNIMIDANNDPKILDFGIARLLNADQRVTRVNTKMGSILYMSPEQILGKEVDFKSDIYSLGITFYETLTAIHPYDIEEDSDFTLQSKILNDYPPPPSAYYPMITKQIEYVISNAINKDPGDRFSSCQEFSEAISDPYYTGEYLYSDREVKPVVHHTPVDLKPEVNEYPDTDNSNENSFNTGKDSAKKWKGSETIISDHDSASINDEAKEKRTVSRTDPADFYMNRRIFYSSPVFYISVLLIVLIVFTGLGIFYYNSKDELPEDTNIIKTDSTKVIIKTQPPPPVIEDKKESTDNSNKNATQKSNNKRTYKPKNNYKTDYEGTNNNNSQPPKKTKTTFE